MAEEMPRLFQQGCQDGLFEAKNNKFRLFYLVFTGYL